MKVAVVGAQGQLGADVCAAFAGSGDDVAALAHGDADVRDLRALREVLAAARPALIVNTAAMHHLDRCEEDAGQAYEVNAVGARNLAVLAVELDAALMHVSTDYVFSGSKRSPYLESDLPGPLNVYGSTKLAGELFVESIAPRSFVIRTSGLYGHHPCRGKGLNFVDRMLQLAREREQISVVDNEILTPTSTVELASQMVKLGHTERYGLYHATAEGSCSWHEFARAIFDLSRSSVALRVAGPDEFPVKTPRPAYSVLENRRLDREALNIFRPWRKGLKDYLGAA